MIPTALCPIDIDDPNYDDAIKIVTDQKEYNINRTTTRPVYDRLVKNTEELAFV